MNNLQNSFDSSINMQDQNLKVTYYARVSTDSYSQLNSLENQIIYYKNYIKKNKKWTYVEGYVDEGKSGVTVNKRNAFLKMINDASLKKFNLIITKEVSRFARDLEDSIHYIRLLKNYGVCIYFENQNLNTFDINSELILNLMFNLAQEESQKLSRRIKFGHEQSMKKGHVLGPSLLGYYKDNCKLKINPEESKLVKRIYELYNEDKYGLTRLSNILFEEGYANKNGKKYDKDTLKRIITNPKYKGFYNGHIYETINYRTKERKKIPQNCQITYKTNNTIIPPIVDEYVWNKANEIYKRRSKKYNLNNKYSYNIKYPFSSKIKCNKHNKNYQRFKNKSKIKWACSEYLKYGIKECDSPIIPEEDLLNIFKSIINIKIDIREIKEDLLKRYEKNIYINNIKTYTKNKINIEQNKKEKIIELYKNNILELEEVKTEMNKCNEKIKYLTENINNNNSKEAILKNIKLKLNNIKEELFLDEFIRVFLERITVEKINNMRNNLNLRIYINTKGINKMSDEEYKKYNKNNEYIGKNNKYSIILYLK